MPILLRDVKRSLERDLSKVGKKPNGDYKFTPPNIVARKLRDYPLLGTSKVEGTPRPGTNVVTFTGLVKSESTPVKYKVTVQFHDVSFKDAADEKHSTEVKVVDAGKVLKKYHEPIKVKNHPVSLKCQCQDFRHRFETELSEHDALIGAPRKYKRKTPAWPVGNPYANSTEKVGFCKHVWSLLDYLNQNKLIKE